MYLDLALSIMCAVGCAVGITIIVLGRKNTVPCALGLLLVICMVIMWVGITVSMDTYPLTGTVCEKYSSEHDGLQIVIGDTPYKVSNSDYASLRVGDTVNLNIVHDKTFNSRSASIINRPNRTTCNSTSCAC